MKILFINLPFSGHIIPTLGLVKELLKRKNQVTYLLAYEWKNHILQTGAEFMGYKNAKKLSDQLKNAYDAADEIAKEYDLILYEQFFFLGKHVAEKWNKPAIRIFTSIASNKEIMKEFINAGGALTIFRSQWVCRKFTKNVSKGIPLMTDSWLKEIIQNPPNLNFVYTIREFQPYEEEFPDEHFKFIGASIYKRDIQSEFQMPVTNKKIIYISLGTIVNNAKSFYKKCMKAFEKEDVMVIMSIGNLVKRNSLGHIPDNFYIYSSVPQLEVLEKSDVFITHGGLNSVSEAMYFGVPMVVFPYETDQPLNAKCIERLGVGKRLDRKKVTSELLKTVVTSLLNDNTIAQNTKKVKEKMQSAPGNSFASDLIMKYFDNY